MNKKIIHFLNFIYNAENILAEAEKLSNGERHEISTPVCSF